jgi:DNA-binding LacI/PurR family transcriptional regulator
MMPYALHTAPVYKRDRLAQELRRLAQSLTPGDRFPSVPQLEQRYRLSTGTVEAAVEILHREGVLERRRGSGTYLRRCPVRPLELASTESLSPHRTLVIVADSVYPYFRRGAEALTTQARAVGLKVVCQFQHHEVDMDRLLAETLELEALRPAGFLVFAYRCLPVATALLERGYPTALIGLPPPNVVPSVPCVYGDQAQGEYLAVRRLTELGHRRIAFGHRILDTRRGDGVQRALTEGGAIQIDIAETETGFGLRGEDPEAIRRDFARTDAPTALVARSDSDAFHLMRRLHRAGLRIPDDVSVIGYDNLPVGAHTQPPLDTVDGHLDQQMHHALSLLQTPDPLGSAPTIIVPPTLICRQSCGPVSV